MKILVLSLLLIGLNSAKDVGRSVRQTSDKNSPDIYSLHVKSQILSRFATTLVTSRLANQDTKAKETVFVVQLPNAAFISNFSMEIGGKVIIGEVKEKEKAKRIYDKAKSLGQSAGHVAQVPRETNTFHISVNVAAKDKITFNLTYQEILQRVHGVYKHIVNIQPGQVVDDLKVDVFITEAREITTIHVPKFGEKVGENTNQDLLKSVKAQDVKIKTAITPDLSHVHVMYYPDAKKQKQLAKNKLKGLVGQLVVLYDVKREKSGGDIQVVNGYFVHFFAPSDVPVSNKDVIFVLDTSGSMSGRKIDQTKEAMKVILKDLDGEDKFNILEFDDTVRQWRRASVTASESNVRAASKFVRGLYASGGTNINAALQSALNKLLSQAASSGRNPVIIFLTDGQATTGETSNSAILNNAKITNYAGKVSIHSIGFGSGADFDLLKRLSLENHGVARKVYEDSDAVLQLQGFYTEISTVLLTDVNIKYLNETVEPDSIVQDSTYNYYHGSEIVTVGKMKDANDLQSIMDAEVSGISMGSIRRFKCRSRGLCHRRQFRMPCLIPYPPNHHPTAKPEYEPLAPETLGGFIERMWAYLSIKKLLEKSKFDSKVDSRALREKALILSLKYHFVTELTSMVVVQPDQESAQTLGESDNDGDQDEDDVDKFLSLSGKPNAGGGGQGGGRGGGSSGTKRKHKKPNTGSSPGTKSLPPVDPKPSPGFKDIDPNGDIDIFGEKEVEEEEESKEEEEAEKQKPDLSTEAGEFLPDEPEVKPTTTDCGKNETNFDFLARNCEYKCSDTYRTGQKCPLNNGCRCLPGYLRQPIGNCVRPLDCANAPKTCSDPNAMVHMCGKACPQIACNNRTAFRQACKLCGPPACICKQGYLLSEAGPNGKCIFESDCS